MNCSLEKLVASLNNDDFKITRKLYDKIDLLTRKGVYPYQYVDSFERFSEEQLPPIEAFYSDLSREQISVKDYDHAQNVWKEFNCKTLGDYHDLYLKTDVTLLADVFEQFRNTSMCHYGLDPAHYFTAPGMSWDALLKKTGVELELLTDIDQHLFIEKGIRGGISMVSKRHAKANNPFCSEYNPTKPNTWIEYLDANNLYAWSMMQCLPKGNFEWVEAENIKEVLTAPPDSPIGYILEVDLQYPKELHDSHSDYPLAPESLCVPENWFSDYQHNLLKKLQHKYTECKKLVPNLHNKEKYVLHYRNLQYYLKQGMILGKVHRILKFSQSAWMAPYINLNTELRKRAKSDFEKDFFKLMNNSVFGKTMENLRKRIRVNLLRPNGEGDKIRRLIADPAFQSRKLFDGNLVAIHSKKAKLKLNKPIYIGQAVLDLSKLLMYEFWYNDIKAQYGSNAQLLYTDTDSLLVEIETQNIYDDMCGKDVYDFSDYPKDHRCFSETNKKVVGKFKDECAGQVISEFVGLRPKMYSILKANGNEIKKAKGVSKAVVKKDLRHNLYLSSLMENKETIHNMVSIRSENHKLGLYSMNKISLSPLDTKKWIAPDGVTTLAYGHHQSF